MDRSKSMVAVGLEVGPGILLQTFGVGHMYSGRFGTGLAIMFSYWMLQAINAMLVSFMGLGLVTGLLTFLGFLVFCPTNVLSSRAPR